MNRAVRRLSVAPLAVLIALGGSLLGAGVADATACPYRYTCTWDGFNYQGDGYTGRYLKFQWYIPDYRNFVYAGTSTSGNDTASSISNNGATSVVYAFKDLNCSGYSFTLGPGAGDGNLSDNAGNITLGGYYGFNNSLTSAACSAQLTNCQRA